MRVHMMVHTCSADRLHVAELRLSRHQAAATASKAMHGTQEAIEEQGT